MALVVEHTAEMTARKDARGSQDGLPFAVETLPATISEVMALAVTLGVGAGQALKLLGADGRESGVNQSG